MRRGSHRPQASYPPVFISFRVSEASDESKALQTACGRRGVGAFVCEEVLSNAEDWVSEITGALQACQVFVAMVSETFGNEGSEILDTFHEFTVRPPDLLLHLP